MMLKDTLNDTITAISTPLGQSGIGIVRISGDGALGIIDKIFVAKDGGRPSSFKTYTLHYGWIVDNSKLSRNGGIPQSAVKTHNSQLKRPKEFIDEVILTVMRGPKSYTRQDIVEINCHGGIVALRQVLDLVLDNGARIAEPGEFTKRAFLNGRINLTQAEAVLDIINAKSEVGLKIGVEQLKGSLSDCINKVREGLLDKVAALEADIDFPEEEIGFLQIDKMRQDLEDMQKNLLNILSNARLGRIYREGIRVVICGRPNSGKSSLLNALLQEERSIVTPVAGTTRDTIEEIIEIKGLPMRIVDTAGILEPRDLVEKKAIQHTKRSIETADLIILLFDGSKRLGSDDAILMNKLKKKTLLVVVNKIDLPQKIEKGELLKKYGKLIYISAKKPLNINRLEEAIVDLVMGGKITTAEPIIMSNLRHIQAIKGAQKLIAEALNSLDNTSLLTELIVQNLKDAVAYFDEILGKRYSEELLDKIFSEFCIGK